MKKDKMQRKTILVISFLVLSVVFSFLTFHICYSRMKSRMESTKQFAAGEEHKICYAVESRIITAKALEMYVLTHDGDVSDFREVAAFFYEDDPAVRSIQLAPNGVVTQDLMYPREENFVTHDLFADPDRRDDAIKARDSGEIILSGPYELRQGGKGIIVRNPIYMEDENGHKNFWGFSMVIFNVPEVFNIEHLNLLTSDKYYYRLWRYLPDSENTQLIVGNVYHELKNAVRKDISICNVLWHLDIVPQDRWVPRQLLVLLILAFSVILVLSMIGISSHLKIREIVYYDSLLNIENINCLSEVFTKIPQNTLTKMYLVVFDIDKFKEYNYIYGEENGDKLLKYIVEVFREELPEVRLFRYYSDYFITLNEGENTEDHEKKMGQILSRFNRDIENGVIHPFDISAGVRKIEKGEPLQRIISDALIARGTIKGNHLTHYGFYDGEIRRKRIEYMKMESDFLAAMQNKEFHVYYQPKYSMLTGEIIGAEALVRWIKPDGNIISPGVFLPCFEESRQIYLLDEVVLREVCSQMKEMLRDGLDIKPVSVNLSRVHLRHFGILSKIEQILKEFDIDPTMLSFEITESALYEDSIPLKSIVNSLHNLGCRVDMDDYGVGVSGPKSLASYDFDTVKLDKSFVDDISNPRVADIIRGTALMVKQWGMHVIAEGVETKEQVSQLVDLGCVSAQGFYYSRPVPEEEYRKLLKNK